MVYLEVGLVIVLVLLLLAGVMTSIIQAAWCDCGGNTGGYGGIRGDTPPPAPVYLPTHDPRHLRSPARGRS